MEPEAALGRSRIAMSLACLAALGGACGKHDGMPPQQGTCAVPGGAGSDGAVAGGRVEVITSAAGAYWQAATWGAAGGGKPDVTIDDCVPLQTWEGFGGAFNELGWSYLTTPALQDEAVELLFGADGARFAWGRIPVGASDYAVLRYTLDDTGEDVVPDGSEANRPPTDPTLSRFSIARDQQMLIPYLKAAQAKNPGLRFWASPWTPPAWMKIGYRKTSTEDGNARRPSYFDGGSIKADADTLRAQAAYLVRFVAAYAEQGIPIEVVAPQNEPNYDTNYPSCLWAPATYVAFVKLLGPALSSAGLATKVMLGTLSNADGGKDQDIADAVLGDAEARGAVSLIGVQWDMLGHAAYLATSGLPVWATEHKCGNYPWQSSYEPIAPNDHAYAKESWGEVRKAIRGGVTAYNAWNMVLDRVGKGIDKSRDWAQNALLIVDGGRLMKTPAYYVFRHFSRFVDPGAKVVPASGGDALGFVNPDGSLVAVLYAGAAKVDYTVRIAGQELQFAMPADGWATVKYRP
jgi:glucosylceramidase